MSSEPVADGRITRVIESALIEDIGAGDVTSEAVLAEDAIGFAEILCKGDGVIAGLEVAAEVFALVDPGLRVELLVPDGSAVRKGDIVARVRGSAKGILQGERTALNFLQRMSGIATITRAYVNAVAGTKASITDTRKTAPGLRVIDKLAVRLGGGVNHRFGLDDMVLIKDNHIVAAGSITRAVDLCNTSLQARGLHLPLEVETKNLAEVNEALQCTGITRIMLDNFPLDQMAVAVRRIAARVEVEASGGITLDTVRAVAETGVDVISVGALTHSVRALDISLELSHHV
jgi:nicotinate-nucleotide pyrophosphorylase (carboxylating)